MFSPRTLMYVALGAAGWMVVKRMIAQRSQPKQAALPRPPPQLQPTGVPGIERRGDDALCGITLSRADAKAGKSVVVPSLEGQHQIEVPAGVKDGAKLRIAGLGFARPDGSRGDQLVVVQIAG